MIDHQSTGNKTIVVAGATGHLGDLVTQYLLARHTHVKALVRKDTSIARTEALRQAGATVIALDYQNVIALTEACKNADCVVSALSGRRDVIVNMQSNLLKAAVDAGVPRFIPSDYCIDFTKLPDGSNRNLDLRREFSMILNSAPIQSTSILNGMFMDLLKDKAPVVLPGQAKVIYWGDVEQPMDFTSLRNTAQFTAEAALDGDTPRFLRIAGQVASINDLRIAASEAKGKEFKTFRIGGLGMLQFLIKAMRTIMPARNEVFPPWQGMQYLHNMLSGLPKLSPLDNDRYPDIKWMKIREVLA
jgi:nucleoside-diphosphate-sugar epimerase